MRRRQTVKQFGLREYVPPLPPPDPFEVAIDPPSGSVIDFPLADGGYPPYIGVFAEAYGGVPPYSYSWSPGGTYPNSAGTNYPTYTSPNIFYDATCTVSDSAGHTISASTSFQIRTV